MKKYIDIAKDMMATQTSCQLGSVTAGGFPKIRAMLMPIKVEGNNFWFHTNLGSRKVEEFKQNTQACLYFHDNGAFQGITFLGEMEVLDADNDKAPFWKETYKPYYANGVGMSDFCILKFTAVKGELYQNLQVEVFC